MLTPDTQRQIAHHIGLDTMARIFGLQWDYEHMCAGHQGGVGRGKRYDIAGGVLTYGLYGEEQAIKLATLRKTQRQALPGPTVALEAAAREYHRVRMEGHEEWDSRVGLTREEIEARVARSQAHHRTLQPYRDRMLAAAQALLPAAFDPEPQDLLELLASMQ